MWTRWLRQRRTWIWLAIALVVRGGYFALFLQEHGLHGAWYGWGAENGDTPGYFEPIDAHLRGEGYRPDFRMPGYGLPYLVLRLYTTPQGAGTGIIFLQLLLGMVSVMALGRTLRLLGASDRMATVGCFAYALVGRVAIYDVCWFTESFCTSALILAVHGWLAHLRTGALRVLVWSGGWAAWAVFLKPVFALWLVLLAIGIVLLARASLRRRLVLAGLFLLPFALSDGWWIRRNWIMHGTFVPLSNGTIMPELRRSPMLPLMRFLQATGGNYLHWDPAAHIRWFNMREGPRGAPGKRKDRGVEMPAFALSPGITADSLRALAAEMPRYSDPILHYTERREVLRRITARCDRYIRTYRNERPWQYHVMARHRLTGLFFRMAGLGPLFPEQPRRPGFFTAPVNLLDTLMHWTLVVGGLVAAVAGLVRGRAAVLRWLSVLTLVGVFIHPWGLRLCEGRYLVPMLPFLLLLILAVASDLLRRRDPKTIGAGRA